LADTTLHAGTVCMQQPCKHSCPRLAKAIALCTAAVLLTVAARGVRCSHPSTQVAATQVSPGPLLQWVGPHQALMPSRGIWAKVIRKDYIPLRREWQVRQLAVRPLVEKHMPENAALLATTTVLITMVLVQMLSHRCTPPASP
jgi:hypothetical protein